MKTGIFGGAFNPVHTGHIRLALNYLNSLKLDRIIFIPTSVPPHKSGSEFVSFEDRANMLSLAIGGRAEFEISDIEFKREGKSYTYDTLCELKKLYPDDELFLIMGSDQFLYFNCWYKAQEIADMATICTAARNGEDYKKLIDFKNENAYLCNAIITDFSVFDISSSELRNMIKNNESISKFVPEAVEKYIKENKLYV
ncbi:MAG: nicotinate (nicotinamide) nucleotide adenylyltransferase [Ruminococcaceae bacterium]|nr:nicotinate (nicotinamide) nucleotide adenylyltransferase [Oscillospiraceae bacterium]